jgi:hypothetical protein
MLPINEELKVDNVLLPYPIISEFIDMSSHRMIMQDIVRRISSYVDIT